MSRDDVDALRRQLGLSGKTVVGLFGRLSPWKGQHVALEALAELPDVHLLLVGDALFGETQYEQTLRRRCDDLSLTDRVHFTGFRHDVPQLMKSVDIVVHASTAPEPFGRVIVEGMLARRPVVATRAGGVEEIVRDGETGLLVTPGDPRALASAIRSLLDRHDTANCMVAAARADAERRFTVDAMVQGKTRCLEEIAH
ncbi:MAG: glycosyltransferase family 4 protein [Vicinamibacterales bacterium]